MTAYLKVSDEVQTALDERKPIVALESTVLTHGLDRPENTEAAHMFENAARAEGAIPATVGMINGQVHIGMTDDELELLCSDPKAVKISSHDLSACMTQKITGSTTVATTTLFAQIAGISFFATGGIGGIHRDASESFDISNDITQIASNQICIVSSGVKSILDIGKTLECFETNSVPVYGWQTDEFPAFYSINSGYSCPYRFDDLARIVDAIDMHWNFFPGGVIIANPPPVEYALEHSYVESIIQEALNSARVDNVRGKDITPYLLAKMHTLSNGKTQQLNIKLLESNISLAAKASKELCLRI